MPERTCALCWGPLPAGVIASRRFCSKRCQAKDWRDRHPEKWKSYATAWRRTNLNGQCSQLVGRNCLICGSAFSTAVLQPKATCGMQACVKLARKLRKRRPVGDYQCLYCEQPILSARTRILCGAPECRRRWVVAKARLRRALTWGAATDGKPISPARIVRAANGTCYLCETSLCPAAEYGTPQATVLDHVVPLARGGAHCESALRAVHADCNLRKGDRFLGELEFPFPPPRVAWSEPRNIPAAQLMLVVAL